MNKGLVEACGACEGYLEDDVPFWEWVCAM